MLNTYRINRRYDKWMDSKVWRPHFNPFTKTDTGITTGKQKKGLRKQGLNEVLDFVEKLNLGRKRKKEKNLISVISKKRKKYPIYKFVMNSGKLLSYYKVTDFSGWKSHYGINNTNKVVGFTPDYIGMNPSRIITNNNLFLTFSHEYYSTIKKNTSNSFFLDMRKSAADTRVVISRGFDTSHSHMKEFLKDNNKDDNNTTLSIINQLAKNSFKWFYTPEVSFYDNKEIDFFIRVNLEANAGHYTSKIINQKKKFTNSISRDVAKRLYGTLMKMPFKNFYLWDVLGREKDIKLDFDSSNWRKDVDTGSRVILNTEDPMSTLLMWFAQKIQLCLDSEDDKTFNILGSFGPKKFKKIAYLESSYDYKLEADWTFFDSNVDTQYIEAACLILLSGLPDDKLHRNIRYLITKSIVTKYIAIPPGIVVELNRGVPSGHPFTTLINCTINTIYWALIGESIYGENYADNMKVEVYGDDTYAYFKDHVNLFKIDDIIKKLGLKSAPLASEFRLCDFNYEDNEKPDFLKRRFDDDTIKWNHKKFFDKIFYQSKKRSFTDQVLLLLSYYETAPHDDDMLEYIKLFYKHLLDTKIIDTIDPDTKKILEGYASQPGNTITLRKKYSTSSLIFSENNFINNMNLLVNKGSHFKYTLDQHGFFKPKQVQVDLLYAIAFPIDFVSKNKFIMDSSSKYEMKYLHNEEYFDDFFGFINELSNKHTNIVMKYM